MDGKVIYNPGSNQALEHGCTCPVIDNHYGKGVPYTYGTMFVHNGDCPLHGVHKEVGNGEDG